MQEESDDALFFSSSAYKPMVCLLNTKFTSGDNFTTDEITDIVVNHCMKPLSIVPIAIDPTL